MNVDTGAFRALAGQVESLEAEVASLRADLEGLRMEVSLVRREAATLRTFEQVMAARQPSGMPGSPARHLHLVGRS